jgi:hypothetical protein
MSVRHGKYLNILLFNQASEHRERERKKKFNPKGGKIGNREEKRKTYKPYLGFHSKRIPYPTYKILPKNLLYCKHSIIKELKNLWRISCRFVGLLDPAVIKLTRI